MQSSLSHGANKPRRRRHGSDSKDPEEEVRAAKRQHRILDRSGGADEQLASATSYLLRLQHEDPGIFHRAVCHVLQQQDGAPPGVVFGAAAMASVQAAADAARHAAEAAQGAANAAAAIAIAMKEAHSLQSASGRNPEAATSGQALPVPAV